MATVEQWGAVDQASMIEHLARLRPGASLGLVGHSFGGQVLGLADNISGVDAAVLICSQSGHWRHWPLGRRRLRMLALWWLLIPGLTAATGRFPGSWIGTANLPASIARSWARWGRSRHYVCDARGRPLRPHNDDVRFPIRWMSFCDDPDRAVRRGRGIALLLSRGARSSAAIWRPSISAPRRSAISASSASRCRARRGMTLLLGSRSVCRGRATPVARLLSRRRRSRHWSGAPPAGRLGADTKASDAFLEKRPAAFKGR